MIINLIENTTTKKGFKISEKIDTAIYKTKEKITKEEYEQLNLQRHETNPQWKYTISKIR